MRWYHQQSGTTSTLQNHGVLKQACDCAWRLYSAAKRLHVPGAAKLSQWQCREHHRVWRVWAV